MASAEESNSPQPQKEPPRSAPARPASPLADPALAPFLRQSPTLQAGLSQLRRDGLDVVWGAAGGGTYLVPGKQIVIDENAVGQGGRIARSLSHEIGHHRFTERPDPSSRQAYVTSMLRGEAAATLSNAQVRREIIDHQGPDIGISGTGTRPQQYGAIADQHLAGRITRDAALNQIGQVFKTEQPSAGPAVTYEQYYGDYYDTHVAPRQRRQDAPEPGTSTDLPSAQQGLRGRDPQATASAIPSVPSHPGHEDHALYQQIRSGVEQLDAQHGRSWDGASQRMTASLLALAKEEGLSRVDHVVLNKPTSRLAGGEKVFVVQGALDDPAHHRAHMPTMDAVQTPEAQSFERVQALVEARDQRQALEHSQAQDVAVQAGPSLSR